MDTNFNPTPSDAHPESMDFLSLAWCNFAVQALQPELEDRSVIILDNSIKQIESYARAPIMVSRIASYPIKIFSGSKKEIKWNLVIGIKPIS